MLPDLRHIDPETLKDDIWTALLDSVDQDWTCLDGAEAVMRLLAGIETGTAETVKQGSVPKG